MPGGILLERGVRVDAVKCHVKRADRLVVLAGRLQKIDLGRTAFVGYSITMGGRTFQC